MLNMKWFSDSKNCPDKKKSGKLFPNVSPIKTFEDRSIGNPLISTGFPLKTSREKNGTSCGNDTHIK